MAYETLVIVSGVEISITFSFCCQSKGRKGESYYSRIYGMIPWQQDQLESYDVQVRDLSRY